MLALDISNYTDEISPAKVEQWAADGVGLVIVQAFPQYRTALWLEQCRQVDALTQAGMPFDFYVYDYLASPDWRNACISGMLELGKRGITPRRIWADQEDTSTPRLNTTKAVAAIRATLTALDKVPSRLGITGIYTGGWWWTPYTANYQGFADRPWWPSQYDHNADASVITRYGGWSQATIKQFAGTSTFDGIGGVDLNVLSIAEADSLNPPQEQPPVSIIVGQGMQTLMQFKHDAPLFGHRNWAEVDDAGNPYSVEECYGELGRYVSSNSSGQWVNAGPF